MKVVMYKEKNNPDPYVRRYVLIPTGKDTTTLPEQLRMDLGDLELDRKIVIHPGEKRIALDIDEAIKKIVTEGYYMQETQIQSKLSVG